MSFHAYVPFGSVAAGATVTQDFNVPLSGAFGNLTTFGFKAKVSGGPVMVQLGFWNGSTWTPYATKQTLSAETLEMSCPEFFRDGSQQVRISLTNLDSVAHNYYADCDAD